MNHDIQNHLTAPKQDQVPKVSVRRIYKQQIPYIQIDNRYVYETLTVAQAKVLQRRLEIAIAEAQKSVKKIAGKSESQPIQIKAISPKPNN